MKQLQRTSCPDVLSDNLTRLGYYSDLRDKSRAIKPIWNKKRVIRDELRAMSGDCCCFCGCKISDGNMDVDHYLPKGKYPFLSYCWDNLLPTCKNCNRRIKNVFAPLSLKDHRIADICLAGAEDFNFFHCFYHKPFLLGVASNDRLIEPTHDVVAEHLEFYPAIHSYEGKTPIGILTNENFFKREEFERTLAGISEVVQNLVFHHDPSNLQKHVNLLVDSYGHEFYYHQYLAYWQAEKLRVEARRERP